MITATRRGWHSNVASRVVLRPVVLVLACGHVHVDSWPAAAPPPVAGDRWRCWSGCPARGNTVLTVIADPEPVATLPRGALVDYSGGRWEVAQTGHVLDRTTGIPRRVVTIAPCAGGRRRAVHVDDVQPVRVAAA